MKQHRNEQRRAITINDNLWDMVAQKADIDGIKSMSTVIRLLLQAYVDSKVEIVARPVITQ
jgi:hypothetical protein